jgi:hypothetical protein
MAGKANGTVVEIKKEQENGKLVVRSIPTGKNGPTLLSRGFALIAK